MSDRTKQQFLDTFARLREATSDVVGQEDLAKKRAALQDVVSLCDSFKAACVGYSSVLGYAKREKQFQRPDRDDQTVDATGGTGRR